MASVRPLRAVAVPATVPVAAASGTPAPKVAVARPVVVPAVQPPPAARASAPAAALGVTLDGGWDRRLTRGVVEPDDTVDLHGHTLATAYALLDRRLGDAIGRDDRVVLLVTGKPPRPESERPHARGAIRAAVADWLAGSPHAGHIAAVRNAHPRHGGAGALYIILRRRR